METIKVDKLFALLVAILPGLLYVPIISGNPKRASGQIVGIGLLAGATAGITIIVLKSLFLQDVLQPPIKETLTLTLFVAFIEAGLLEEFFKNGFFLLAIRFFFPATANENFALKPYDIFALGAFVGLGFGLLENANYAFNPELGKLSVLLDRAYTAIPAHIIMNATFGFLKAKKLNLFLCFAASILIHSVYDFFALPSTLLGGILLRILLVTGLGFCLWMGKDLLKLSRSLNPQIGYSA
jgi:RsiW-degrading membrane proteinase PrsW (M82 family)